MVYKCGNEITPHIPAITKLCLQYICYDPNYNYEEEGDGDDEQMECDDEVRKFAGLKIDLVRFSRVLEFIEKGWALENKVNKLRYH